MAEPANNSDNCHLLMETDRYQLSAERDGGLKIHTSALAFSDSSFTADLQINFSDGFNQFAAGYYYIKFR